MTVCFHGDTSCPFCHIGPPSVMPRHRRRLCPACGRTLPASHRTETCTACTRRRFRPLHLFTHRRKKAAA